MSNKGQMLQDPFLNTLRKEHVQVSIYLVNGIKLQGQIESFDQYVVLLKNTVTQMVYKHAISTVVPARAVAMPHHARRPTRMPDRRRDRLPDRASPTLDPAPSPRVGSATRLRPRAVGASPNCMFERPKAVTGRCSSPWTSARATHERLAELTALAASAGATVAGAVIGPPQAARCRAVRGQGQGRRNRARGAPRPAPSSSSSTTRCPARSSATSSARSNAASSTARR